MGVKMLAAIKMHRKILLVALLIIAAVEVVIYFMLRPALPDETTSEKEVPDVMKELAQNESVEWMASI